jgi:FkbM family methyltransferase
VSSLYSMAKKATPLPFKKGIRKLRKLISLKTDFGWTVKSGLKVRVASDSDWVIYNDIFVDGEYDIPIQLALRSAPTDRPLNVLDVGANVGFFTLRFVDLLRRGLGDRLPFRITLVEGSPKIAADLSRRLLDENRLGEGARIVQGLVGERAGAAKFAEYDFHATNSIFFDRTADSVKVNFVDLDKLFDQDEAVDLLKCDIEGAELRFIENYPALLRRTSAAVFELHHDKCDTERCRKLLSAAGLSDQRLLRQETTFSVWHFLR